MMIDIAKREYKEKCKTCGNQREGLDWDYCPFCGEPFPEENNHTPTDVGDKK